MLKLLLQNKKFAMLVISSTITEFGSFFTYMLLIVLSYERTQSMVTAMGILLSSSVGSLLTGTFAGVIVDRFSAAKVLIAANSFSAIVIASLFFLPHNYWFYYMITFFTAVFASFAAPAFNKIQVTLINNENRLQANASIQTLREITKIIAPGAATFVLAALPEKLKPVGFLIDASTYVIAVLLVIPIAMTTQFARTVADEKMRKWESFKKDWKEGWIPFKDPVIAGILMLFFLIIMCIAGFDVVLSAHIFQSNLPTVYVGYIISALSAGIISFSFVGSKIIKSWPVALRIGGAVLGMGIFYMGLGWFNGIIEMIICAFLLGCFNAIYNMTAPTYFHENVPTHLMGRFYGLVGSIMSILSILGMTINGYLGSMIGPQYVLLVFGVIKALLGAMSIFYISIAVKKRKEQNAIGQTVDVK
jgi:MFS family permease